MSEMVIRCGGKVIGGTKAKPVTPTSRPIKKNKGKLLDVVIPMSATAVYRLLSSDAVMAASTQESAQQIRESFMQILDVFTAICEPILWFYALTGCILMVTKSKDAGLGRLKSVAYSYGAITLLPTFFEFIRWMAMMLKDAIHF